MPARYGTSRPSPLAAAGVVPAVVQCCQCECRRNGRGCQEESGGLCGTVALGCGSAVPWPGWFYMGKADSTAEGGCATWKRRRRRGAAKSAPRRERGRASKTVRPPAEQGDEEGGWSKGTRDGRQTVTAGLPREAAEQGGAGVVSHETCPESVLSLLLFLFSVLSVSLR